MAIFGVHSLDYEGKETNIPLSGDTSTKQIMSDTPSLIECLYKLARNLEKIAFKDSVQVFNTAKVPIVKMRDAKSGVEVDISFGVSSGKENAKVVIGILRHRSEEED
jgi:hypothetical protein